MPNNDYLTEGLLETIQTTMETVKDLVEEIKDGSDRMNSIESKLQSLADMKLLLNSISEKNYDASIVAKIEFVEHQIEEIKEELERQKDTSEELKKLIYSDEKENLKNKKEKTIYLMKLLAVAVPGIISLIILFVKYMLD